jgi:hypothetical protein
MLASNSSEDAFEAGSKLEGSGNLARVIQGSRETVCKRIATGRCSKLESDLVSIGGAGNLAILVSKIAGSCDLVVGQDQFAYVVGFVSLEVGMNGPWACQVLRRECCRGNQEGKCCEKNLHGELPS